MVWYGMVWYGMVWYGMVWYGMVWYGMRVNADRGSHFHPLVLQSKKHFTKGEICQFSAFPFSLKLMFDETLSTSYFV